MQHEFQSKAVVCDRDDTERILRLRPRRARRARIRCRDQFRHDSRDHRHRTTPHGEHAGRADLDAGADRQTLQQLNIQTFDDYIKYLPNVTTANNGPGQNEVFMRGLSAGSQASQGSGSTGLWPNVAIYLDNQSGQLPNRNLDIYAADLNRIEVLEGPQGTLFGAGAEAGAIRYITNEPKLDVTEGNVTAGYGITASGNPNTSATAVLNLPLIEGSMAVRGVIYNDSRGGYIDNVPATFTRKNTDIGIYHAYLLPNAKGICPNGQPPGGGAYGGYCVPPGSEVINNNNVTGNAINPVTYQGIRVEALYKFTDDWNALLSQTYQNMNAQGVFYQQPNTSDGAPLPPLEVTLFNPAYDKDKFESTASTVNGKFGALKAVYTGGYLVSNVDQVGGLHELRPRRVRRLLPMLRADRRQYQRSEADLLLAECHLVREGAATPTSSTNCA